MGYVPLCFHSSFGSFYSHFFPYNDNSVNFVIGISSMRLNEGSIQISSQMLAKFFRKFLFWCLGWFSLKSLEFLCVSEKWSEWSDGIKTFRINDCVENTPPPHTHTPTPPPPTHTHTPIWRINMSGRLSTCTHRHKPGVSPHCFIGRSEQLLYTISPEICDYVDHNFLQFLKTIETK